MVNLKIPLERAGLDVSNRNRLIASMSNVTAEFSFKQFIVLFKDLFGVVPDFRGDVRLARFILGYALAEVFDSGFEVSNTPRVFERAVEKANALKHASRFGFLWSEQTDPQMDARMVIADAETATLHVDQSQKARKPYVSRAKGPSAAAATRELFDRLIANNDNPMPKQQFIDVVFEAVGSTTSPIGRATALRGILKQYNRPIPGWDNKTTNGD